MVRRHNENKTQMDNEHDETVKLSGKGVNVLNDDFVLNIVATAVVKQFLSVFKPQLTAV